MKIFISKFITSVKPILQVETRGNNTIKMTKKRFGKPVIGKEFWLYKNVFESRKSVYKVSKYKENFS